jgi:hypothetical protein
MVLPRRFRRERRGKTVLPLLTRVRAKGDKNAQSTDLRKTRLKNHANVWTWRFGFATSRSSSAAVV